MTQFDQRYQQVETQYNADQITIQQQPLSLTEMQRKQNRTRMLDRIQAIWINGVLELSVQGAAQIVLELENKPSAVVTPLWHVLREFGKTGPLSSADASIVQVYDHADGEVLILGEPGAGKTTLLLELTRALLERARRDETHPIPVVFNLSLWATGRQSLTEWLASELRTRYQIPPPLAMSWIKTDQVLPLLDGLDEVALPHRAACVEAINTYRQAHGLLSTVVCSRYTDYLMLSTRLLLRTAVVVQPLTPEQIESYLTSGGERLEALRQTLREDADMQTLASTPLMLNVLTLAYQGTPSQEITATGSLGMKREHVFASYVQRMLTRRSTTSRYSAEQTIQWLSWLARQMAQSGQTTFLIERLQPNWLPTRWAYRVSTGLLVGLLCLFVALLAGLIFGMSSSVGQPTGLIVGFIVGSSIGLVGGFLGGLRREIKPAERVTWSWKKAWQGFGGTGLVVVWLYTFFLMYLFLNENIEFSEVLFILNVIVPVIIGLRIKLKPIKVAWSWKRAMWGFGGTGLVVSLLLSSPSSSALEVFVSFVPVLLLASLIGLISGLRIKLKPIRIAWSWSWKRVLRGELVVACLLALSLDFQVLLVALPVGLSLGLSGNTLDKSTFNRPNEGIRRSARNSILSGAIVAFTLCSLLLIVELIVVLLTTPLMTAQPPNLSEWQFLGEQSIPLILPAIMIIMLIVGLIVGGLACIQHITLRVFLRHLKSMPWNYSQFLDYAAERILLRKVGGGYIFLHRLLLDYFADLETRPISNEAAESSQERLSSATMPSVSVVPIGADGISDVSRAQLAPTPVLTDVPHLLPCGHEQRAPNARFCSTCGAPVPS